MRARRAKVSNAQLFKDKYASVILVRTGNHVIGYVLTCEMDDDTVTGNATWKDIKEKAVKAENLE